MTVSITPMPVAWRQIPRRLWPRHPPIFSSEPTARDIARALKLYARLDAVSQDWYGDLPARLRARYPELQPKEGA